MTVVTGIERIRIRNYRVLRDVELDGLTPITALLGPNGSGKSTLLDAIELVYEALGGGLAAAWARRGGLAEIRSRGSAGPVEIELGCRVDGESFTYRLVIEDETDVPIIAEEKLSWRESDQAAELAVLEFSRRRGTIRRPGGFSESVELTGDGVLGVGNFGQLAVNAQIAAFLHFATRIQLSDLDVERMRSGAKGPARTARLDPNGDNIAMRVEHLRTAQPDVWSEIVRSLRSYVPGLADIVPMRLGDGTHIVRLEENGVDRPISPENISDGTLLLLGYLVALRDPASVLLLEEPENQVHPRLQYVLADEARGAESEQVLVATHSPRFVDALRPPEVWVFARGYGGSAEVKRASEEAPVVRMVKSGAALGDLWTEGYFRFGDPLAERL